MSDSPAPSRAPTTALPPEVTRKEALRLAIVGSVSLAENPDAWAAIDDVLARYQPQYVVSGGAKGIDTMAAEAARIREITVVEYRPKVQQWGGPGGFKERNLKIAQDCDALVRIVASDSRTYGSGWTRDRAREMGKHTEEIVISRAARSVVVVAAGLPRTDGAACIRASSIPPPAKESRMTDQVLPSALPSLGGSAPTTVAIPRWMFDHAGERFLVAISPDGTVSIDGGHSDAQGVAKARELYQRLVVIRPPEGTRYVMLTVEDVPPFGGRLNEEAIQVNNHAARATLPSEGARP